MTRRALASFALVALGWLTAGGSALGQAPDFPGALPATAVEAATSVPGTGDSGSSAKGTLISGILVRDAEVDLEAVEELPVAPPPELTLEMVLGVLIDRHPVLLAAEAGRDAVDGDLLSAEGAFDTKVSAAGKAVPFGQYTWHHMEAELTQPTQLWGTTFFGGWRRSGGGLPVYYGNLATVEGGEAVLGLSVPVWQGGAIDAPRAKIRQQKLKRGQADRKVTATHLKLRKKAAEAYWKWVFSGHNRRIAAHVLAIAQRRVAQLESRVSIGDKPEIDLVDNQRVILKRQADWVKAVRGQEAAALVLSLYLRDADGVPRVPELEAVPVHLPEARPALPYALSDDVAHALAHRPELDGLLRGARAAGVAMELADNDAAPQLDLSVAGVQPFGVDQGGLERTEMEAGLKFSLPLQRRKALGALAKARAERSQLDLELRFARDEVSTEVSDARSAMAAARQRVEVSRQELLVARKLEAAETLRLDAGDSTLLILNLRETATAEAAQSLAKSLADQHIAYAAWLAATARGLDGLGDGPMPEADAPVP